MQNSEIKFKGENLNENVFTNKTPRKGLYNRKVTK